jgi:hypothetical protein
LAPRTFNASLNHLCSLRVSDGEVSHGHGGHDPIPE